MDLSAVSVFLDFDGTITLEDTGVYLLEQLAEPEWHEVEERYVTGDIGSKECMALEWAMLPRDRPTVEATARQVSIDPGFVDLVSYLLARGAEVCILSDGFGWLAEEVGSEVGIPVVTNAVDWNSWEVLFPNEDLTCDCALCGACKRTPIRKAKARGRTTVLVGDGASDVKGATVADVVFAKDELADWCATHAVVFEPFLELADVQRALGRLPS
jgi:2-hydroxy-3-keto-5-methylthiopentenyl-1-phosphate phosphatase